MRITANRPLHGSYGTVLAGQTFDVEEDIARQLIASGVASLPLPPRILYETAVRQPESSQRAPEAPEVRAREPFRDGIVRDAESPDVATQGDSVLSSANVSKPGITYRGERGPTRR